VSIEEKEMARLEDKVPQCACDKMIAKKCEARNTYDGP
jgi:hypothetical protein